MTTIALLVLAVLVVFLAVIYVPVWIKPSLSGAELNVVPSGQIRITLQQAQAQLQNSIRSTLFQALGGILVVAGAVATWRQVQISREGQITDRLTHAIDQLGSDKADIRIGGIFALERLARDSAADRFAIGEILAAFIRAHAAWPAGHRSHPDQHPTPDVDGSMLWLTDRAPDVRTAVLVLGRYPHEEREHRLALRRVDLRRTNFYSGTLINVDLADSNLAACYADGVRWERCRFSNADLRKTSLVNAALDKSNFAGPTFKRPTFRAHRCEKPTCPTLPCGVPASAVPTFAMPSSLAPISAAPTCLERISSAPGSLTSGPIRPQHGLPDLRPERPLAPPC